MSPITARIVEWAAAFPDKTALVIGKASFTYAALVHEIGHRAQGIAKENHAAPTINPGQPATEQALNGLAKLHTGLPIIATTSGSTGQAKRYQRSQQSWIASFAADQQEFGLCASDIVVAPGNLTHSLFSYALCHGLYVGATVVLSESFRPDRVLDQIGFHQATVLYGVPTQLKMIAQAGQQHLSQTYPCVRWVLSSGARWFSEITPALQFMFPKAVIGEFYGASELSFVSVAKHGHDQTLPAGSVGRVFHGVNVKIDAGRIWVNSPGLFDRYLSDPPADFSESFDRQGQRWCCIGDLGEMDTKGYLFLLGRESRKIVVSGKNLYPEEVEQLLLTHAAIADAAVMGVPDSMRGERLVAVIRPAVLTPGNLAQPLGRAALISFLRPLLEDYKVPRDYFLLHDWPMTPTGKTDFNGVRQRLAANACLRVTG